MKLQLVGALILCCAFQFSLSAVTTNATAAAVVSSKATTTVAGAAASSAKTGSGASTAKPGTPVQQKTSKVTVKPKITTTPKPKTCYDLTCTNDGCLKNKTKSPSPKTCTGICKIESTIAANVTTITASCAITCKKSTTVYCCTADKCNNDDALIKSQFNGADRVSMKYAGLILAQFLLYWVILS